MRLSCSKAINHISPDHSGFQSWSYNSNNIVVFLKKFITVTFISFNIFNYIINELFRFSFYSDQLWSLKGSLWLDCMHLGCRRQLSVHLAASSNICQVLFWNHHHWFWSDFLSPWAKGWRAGEQEITHNIRIHLNTLGQFFIHFDHSFHVNCYSSAEPSLLVNLVMLGFRVFIHIHTYIAYTTKDNVLRSWTKFLAAIDHFGNIIWNHWLFWSNKCAHTKN